jgi:hypothetical protein
MGTDEEIIETKRLRGELDASIQALRWLPPAREVSIALTKAQEAVMWLGMNLKRINDAAPGASPNPYPNSRNVTNTIIEPTSEGLKL